MLFNYFSEWKKFVKEWKEKEEACIRAGMSKEAIQRLYEDELNDFRKQRIYCLHNESLEALEENQNPRYMESIRFEDTVYSDDQRYGWIEELEDEQLYRAVKRLKKEDLEVLTLWALECYSATEIAKIQRVSQQAVSKRLAKIRNSLKKAMKRL